ncbi:hypothetical protein [uncultured Psychrobacter sp.]|uniref:hypothetical protein n=1 Tax=uncultured Psychrobacter sp. TaxID=259303 RepID=UPI003459B901
MTSKKASLKPNNTPKSAPHISARSKKLIAVILLLLIMVIGYFIWQRSSFTIPSSVQQTSAVSEEAQLEPAGSIKNTNIDNTNIKNTDNDPMGDEIVDTQIPTAEKILNAPLPKTDSLAKEEIDRLEDEYQRLTEQEQLASEQVQMNKKLTEMKAEQIKLLEQQIAQLEAAPTQ